MCPSKSILVEHTVFATKAATYNSSEVHAENPPEVVSGDIRKVGEKSVAECRLMNYVGEWDVGVALCRGSG